VTIRLDTNSTYHGLQAITIENRALSMTILPARGGNILRLIDKKHDVDILWKSPRIDPHQAHLHDNFDDHWMGGWDDIFPTGRSCKDRYGDTLPYLGELWSHHSKVEIIEDCPEKVVIRLKSYTPITPAKVEKVITLIGDQPFFDIEYRITNVGTMPFDFQFGVHPALATNVDFRFDVPATSGVVDEGENVGFGLPGEEYLWPDLNGIDMSMAKPIECKGMALHYLSGLTAGWLAATDTRYRRGFGIAFDRTKFPAVWFCAVYGGWRGYYNTLLEPWTSYPSGLDSARDQGRAVILNAGESFETKITAVIYSGVDHVTSLNDEGSISSKP